MNQLKYRPTIPGQTDNLPIRWVFAAIMLVGLGGWPVAAEAQDAAEIDLATARRQLVEKVEPSLREREAAGFCGVLLLRENDRDVLHRAYGMADRQANIQMTVEHGFDIGSIVKPMTACAVLKLQEQGKLDINDPLVKYFPDAPADNGSLNVVGQGIGGGNMNVGTGTGGTNPIGPNDGNLWVRRNITYGGSLSGPSDRNLKENFQEIDFKEIVAKVADLLITQWNFKSDEKQTLHIGPMAQDFAAAFGLGANKKRINLMDSDGVALAAIKGLSQIVSEKDKEISQLKDAMAEQSETIAELAQRLDEMDALVTASQN